MTIQKQTINSQTVIIPTTTTSSPLHQLEPTEQQVNKLASIIQKNGLDLEKATEKQILNFAATIAIEHEDLVDALVKNKLFQDKYTALYEEAQERNEELKEAQQAVKTQETQPKPVMPQEKIQVGDLGKFQMVPSTEIAGFSNLGNTCYMNAGLQALLASPFFLQEMEAKGLPIKAGERPENTAARQEIHTKLKDLIIFHQSSLPNKDEYILLAIKELHKAICDSGFSKEISAGRRAQQDTAEFLRVIFGDFLQREIPIETTKTFTNQGGNLESRQGKTSYVPSFIVAMPESQAQKTLQLQGLVNAHFADEQVEGWKANGDAKPVTAKGRPDQYFSTKKTSIKNPPDYFSLQLKRAQPGFNVDNRNVDLPADGIITIGKHQYQLRSATLHLGDYSGNGHETSVVRKEGKWYYCDDARTYSITDEVANKLIRGACNYVLEKI